MKMLFIFLTQIHNQSQFISMNPSNTMQMVSSSMSAEPPHSQGIYLRRQPEKWENMINQRIGLVTLEGLINAAKYKQRFEVKVNNLDLPELWSPANAQLLNDVAKDVLQNSKPEDSIKTLANKVVVICTLLHENPMLDKNHMNISVNNAFVDYDGVYGALVRSRRRIQALEARKPRRLHEGGFHKKTKCRGSSKKSKSRKSRSRR
jgi:hypothetical protein